MRFSKNEMVRDKEKVRMKYKSVMVIQISKVRNVAAISSMPWKVSSWTEMTETIAESLMVEMNWPARGNAARRNAWGRTTRRKVLNGDSPRDQAASH